MDNGYEHAAAGRMKRRTGSKPDSASGERNALSVHSKPSGGLGGRFWFWGNEATLAGMLGATMLLIFIGWPQIGQTAEWSDDIQLTHGPADSTSIEGNNALIYDGQGHYHIIYTRKLVDIEDSTDVLYMRLDTLGNILQQQQVSIVEAYVYDLRGVVASSGNIHFFWGSMRNHDFSTMYFRVAPSGEIHEATRRLGFHTPSGGVFPFIDSRNRILLARQFVRGLQIQQMTEEGVLSEDSLNIPEFINSNDPRVIMDQRDMIYVFYGKVTLRGVYIVCSVLDLEGQFHLRDVFLTDSSLENMAEAQSVSISQDSIIYMLYSFNNTVRIRGMALNLETIFDKYLSRDNQTLLAGGVDQEYNFHFAWEIDSLSDLGREHLTYAIINRNGEYLYGPVGISNFRLGYDCFNLCPKSLNQRYFTFAKALNTGAHPITELFFKYFPVIAGSIKSEPRSEVRNPSIDVYPNPTNGKTIIKVNGEFKSGYSLDIYDINSRRVKSYKRRIKVQSKTADLLEIPNDLNTGIYFLRFSLGDQIETRKFIVMK